MPDKHTPLYFQFFTEIGIIEQLSRANLEAQLPSGMVQAHFSALNHLMRVGDGKTPMAMAQALQVPKTSLTHTLGGLEKRGLIDMRANPKDGRSKCVWITDAGRAWLGEVIQKLAANMGGLAEAFPPEVIAELLPKLAEIRAYLDRARN